MRVKSVPDVKFGLMFRCETLSVPVMRRVLGDTLRGLGVDEESVYDLLLAATEACTNVLQHSGREVRGYAVVTSLGAVGCQVEVTDEGIGAMLHETGRGEPGDRTAAQVVAVRKTARQDHRGHAVQVPVGVPQRDRLRPGEPDRPGGVTVIERPRESDDPDPHPGSLPGPVPAGANWPPATAGAERPSTT